MQELIKAIKFFNKRWYNVDLSNGKMVSDALFVKSVLMTYFFHSPFFAFQRHCHREECEQLSIRIRFVSC